jgi:hypothetical protein
MLYILNKDGFEVLDEPLFYWNLAQPRCPTTDKWIKKM